MLSTHRYHWCELFQVFQASVNLFFKLVFVQFTVHWSFIKSIPVSRCRNVNIFTNSCRKIWLQSKNGFILTQVASMSKCRKFTQKVKERNGKRLGYSGYTTFFHILESLANMIVSFRPIFLPFEYGRLCIREVHIWNDKDSEWPAPWYVLLTFHNSSIIFPLQTPLAKWGLHILNQNERLV